MSPTILSKRTTARFVPVQVVTMNPTRAELDAKLRIEPEADRAGFCVTHWMMPSATREAPQKPACLAGAE